MAGGDDDPGRTRRRLLAWGAGTPALLAAIAAAPKDPAYAANTRFLLTAATFAVAIAGIAGIARSARIHRETCRQARLAGISGAVTDTLTYLRNEERLARRGRVLAICWSLAFFGLAVLCQWPQAEPLAGYEAALRNAGLGALLLIPLLALHNRGHFINSLFLRRYLKEQLDHLGHRPHSRWRALFTRRASTASIIAVTGPGRFTVGGFEFAFEDLVKNVLILGQTGSGKTVAVLNTLLEGLIASWRREDGGVGGIVLDAKGDFGGKIEHVCRKYGRLDDLVILDPAAWTAHAGTWRSIAFNPLDNEDDALEVAARLVAVLRMLGLELGSEGSYFLDASRAFLRHAITLVRAARLTEAPSLLDVLRLSQESESKTPFYHRLLHAIAARHPGDLPQPVMDAVTFFESNWAPMADREKSALRGTLLQLLDEFLVAPFNEIFTRPSTVSLGAIVESGRILYVHMPAADRERMSRVVTTLIKLEYQRHILKRPGKARPSFLLCDEFQTFYTAGDGRGDSDFFERSRESRHANLVAAQNLSAFLKRNRNPNDARNFFGNCAVKILLRNTEEETLRWASALFGMRSEIVITTSEQAALDGGWLRRRHTSYGRATRALPAVPPEAFARLAVPVFGDPHAQHAETLIHLASRQQTARVRLLWPVNPLQ